VKKIILTIALLFGFTLGANANEITNNLKNKIDNFFNQTLSEMFPMAEFGLSSGNSDKVTGSIIAINPLSDINDKSTSTFFFFFFFLSDDSRETINLGLATRNLVSDDTMLVGANIFYDHELDHNHQRASIGLEAITSVGSITYNEYWGLSDKKTGVDGFKEEALDGRDLKLGIPLPYLPTTSLNIRSFQWEGVDGATDLEGEDFSLRASISRFNIEIGHRDFDGATDDEDFIRLTYRCCKGEYEKFEISDKAFSGVSVENKRFAKVERENLIVKQKEMDLTVIGF